MIIYNVFHVECMLLNVIPQASNHDGCTMWSYPGPFLSSLPVDAFQLCGESSGMNRVGHLLHSLQYTPLAFSIGNTLTPVTTVYIEHTLW